MAANCNKNRSWTQKEDSLLELISNQTMTYDPDVRYPVLNQRYIGASMNEFASGKAVVKLSVYEADGVESHHSDLTGNSVVDEDMKGQSLGDKAAGEARGVRGKRRVHVDGQRSLKRGSTVREKKD